MSGLVASFAWADVLVDSLLSQFDPMHLQHQTVLGTCSGCDSDFSGGCCAWECAAEMIQSSASAHGLFLDLKPRTVCAP